MKHNLAGPSIVKGEILAAERKMKLGKATGSDIIYRSIKFEDCRN